MGGGTTSHPWALVRLTWEVNSISQWIAETSGTLDRISSWTAMKPWRKDRQGTEVCACGRFQYPCHFHFINFLNGSLSTYPAEVHPVTSHCNFITSVRCILMRRELIDRTSHSPELQHCCILPYQQLHHCMGTGSFIYVKLYLSVDH